MVGFPLSPCANFLIGGEWLQLYTLHFCVPLSAWIVKRCILGYVVPNSQTVVLNVILRFSFRLHHPQASSLCTHGALQHLKLHGKSGFGMQIHEEILFLCLKMKLTTALQIPIMRYKILFLINDSLNKANSKTVLFLKHFLNLLLQ